MSGVCGSDGDGPGGLFSFEEIYRSYLECRKNKRNTINALAFEAALFDNLHRLREELLAGTYRPSRSICFVARQPKVREIFAADFRDRVVRFLAENLRLELNPKRARSGRVADGIDFLGYIVRPHYCLVRRRTVNNLKARLRAFEQELVERLPGRTVYLYPEERLEALLATVNAYFAHFAHAASHRLRKSLLERFPFLAVFFAYQGGKVTRRYPLGARFTDYPSQVCGIRRFFRQEACFVRVGRYYELYDGDAAFGAERLGLRPQPPRRGFQRRCGFHRSMLARYTEKALEARRAVVIVEEGEEWYGSLRMRRPARMMRPAACDSSV